MRKLIWDKVFKNGPSKTYGRQPIKKFTWSSLEYLFPYEHYSNKIHTTNFGDWLLICTEVCLNGEDNVILKLYKFWGVTAAENEEETILPTAASPKSDHRNINNRLLAIENIVLLNPQN